MGITDGVFQDKQVSNDYPAWLAHSRHGSQWWELRLNKQVGQDHEVIYALLRGFDFLYNGECYGMQVCVPQNSYVEKLDAPSSGAYRR